MKRIVCLGGGPAGLYSAILLRKALPAARIEVYERNRPDDTFGWGVVFSDQTMGNFRAADPETHGAILGNFHHWDDIAIHFGGRKLVSGGHGFCGIGRKQLLQILQERAHELGVHQSFQHEVEDDRAFADADLIIAADGVNSRTRTRYAPCSSPTSTCANAASSGWARPSPSRPSPSPSSAPSTAGSRSTRTSSARTSSTVIVETREETWLAHGLDRCDD